MEEKSTQELKKNSKYDFKVIWWGSGIVLFIIFILAVSGSMQSSSQDVSTSVNTPINVCSNFQQSQAKKINFATLNKDPDSFNGTSAEFTGQIVEIKESNGQGVIRLDVTKEDYGWSGTDIIYVNYTGHNNFVENDVVNVYGVLQGSYTYTSQANYQITLPSIIACSVEKPTVQKVSQPISININTTTPATAPTPSAPTVPKTWHTVTTYSASTSTQTPPFSMQGSEWRISYTCSVADTTSYNDEGALNGGIYNASDGSLANFFAEDVTNCPTSNTSYVYAQTPGQYYLDLEPINALVGVTVEDYY
ncbi:MAG: hypothetical protein P4L63_03420 [Candidatus Pacebacteria bacterium]|nr:hypothetical protein [Candidatus Paceibacterota bacterium]